jgi:hypothetical protein
MDVKQLAEKRESWQVGSSHILFDLFPMAGLYSDHTHRLARTRLLYRSVFSTMTTIYLSSTYEDLKEHREKFLMLFVRAAIGSLRDGRQLRS